jgi:hypothetical protein
MTIRKFTGIASGAILTFDPDNDILRINLTAVSAADFDVSQVNSITRLNLNGVKLIRLDTPITSLTDINITFADGSALLVGDNTTATTDDAASNQLFGTRHDDQLLGLGGSDSLSGGLGADRLDGGLGADRMAGGKGDDTYLVDDVDDVVVETSAEGGGIDLVKSNVSYVLSAYVENLTLLNPALGGGAVDGIGNARDNVLQGNAEDNHLFGLAGDDIIVAAFGVDTLEGGGGADTLYGSNDGGAVDGGPGDDRLIYPNRGHYDGGTGFDTLETYYDLDLTRTPDGALVNIEAIDLFTVIFGTLTLSKDDVLAMSPTGTLLVKGEVHDDVIATGTWTQLDDTIIGVDTYAQYTLDGATLQVDVDIDRTGISSELLVALDSSGETYYTPDIPNALGPTG